MLPSHPSALGRAEDSGTAFRVMHNQRFRRCGPGRSRGYELSVANTREAKVNGPAGKFCWQTVCYIEREPRNGSWRICEKVSIFAVSRRPGDRTWNDLLGQRAECSIDTVHLVAGRDAVAANAIDAAASVSGDAAFVAANAKFAERLAIARRDRAQFAEWLAITRRDDAAHADAVFAKRITVADPGYDRS